MTIDEAIKHAEEVAEKQEKMAKEWHENQIRKCDLFPFAEMDYTHENECKECAEEHIQLAEWLKELKQLREQSKWIPVSERLPEDDGKYLEAWQKTESELKKYAVKLATESEYDIRTDAVLYCLNTMKKNLKQEELDDYIDLTQQAILEQHNREEV